MSYTVEEAKTKWCPFYQVSASSGGILTNRNESDHRGLNQNCIADKCMAWIIVEKESRNGTYYPTKDIKGYCSLCNK